MIFKGYIITKSSANTQWLLQRWNIVSIVTIALFHHNKTLRLLYLIKWILLFGVDSPTFQSFVFHFQLPSVFPVMTLPMQLLFSELQQHLTAVCSSSVPPSQPSSPLSSPLRHLQAASAASMLSAVSRCAAVVKWQIQAVMETDWGCRFDASGRSQGWQWP